MLKKEVFSFLLIYSALFTWNGKPWVVTCHSNRWQIFCYHTILCRRFAGYLVLNFGNVHPVFINIQLPSPIKQLAIPLKVSFLHGTR